MTPTLIETVRVRSGAAPLWYLHLRRLAASCKALGVPLPGELLTPEGGPDRVQRLEVGRRGLTVTQRSVPDTLAVRLIVSSVRHEGYPHKTTERGPFDRALAEAREAGADDGVLLTGGGFVAEAAIWTLLWWEDGRVCGPPLSLRILPSVARARIEEMAGGIVERRVRPEELWGRPVLVANAARGPVAVASFEGRSAPEWPDFSRLSERFWA
ncbi:MAG TPA: aminotransferase class IV [Gemmatimonadales bacterium]|nr:aminotransferase class IV [Gemmatimonadales bacterium]